MNMMTIYQILLNLSVLVICIKLEKYKNKKSLFFALLFLVNNLKNKKID